MPSFLALRKTRPIASRPVRLRVNESSQHYEVMRVRKKRTFVEIRERGTEGETDEVVAWRVEEVTTV